MKTFSVVVLNAKMPEAANPLNGDSSRRLSKGGFTLVEMLVVVGIVALLAALAIPNYLKAIQDAKNAKSADVVSMIESAKMALLTEDATTGKPAPAAGTNCNWADIQNFVVVNGQTYASLGAFDQAMGIPGVWSGQKNEFLSLGTYPHVDPATGAFTPDTEAAVASF